MQRGHGDTGDVERPPSPTSCPRDLLPVALVTVQRHRATATFLMGPGEPDLLLSHEHTSQRATAEGSQKKEKKRRPTENEQRELILALAAERHPLRDQLKGNSHQERSITSVGFYMGISATRQIIRWSSVTGRLPPSFSDR